MSQFLSQRWLLSRRHLLRGAGASIALPLLNCMTPLRAAETKAETKPRRSVFIYIPNGVNMLTWQITQAGEDYKLSQAMTALERHRANITPISGLHHPLGIGSRHNCDRVWLTGASAPQEAPTFRNTVSVDQVMAAATSSQTRFGSLELSVSRANNCTLAHSQEGNPLPAEDSPKAAFQRLFGVEPGGVDAQRRGLNRRRSILDLVQDSAAATRAKLGSEDRVKLDDYLDSVREVEKRAARSDEWLNVPKPTIDKAVAANLSRVIPKTEAGDYYRTMYDLIVLAFRTDMTRVVTFMSGGEGTGLAIPEIGVQTRHELSHHNGDPEQLRRLTMSDGFNVEQFAYFLDQLQSVADGGESLLDRTMVLFGSGMSYGHVHANANLPLVLAGGKSLGLKHGKHIDFNLPKVKQYDITNAGSIYALCGRPIDGNARLSNLLLTMLHKMEVNVEQFVDSLGPMSELMA